MVCYNVDEQSALMPTPVSNACIWLFPSCFTHHLSPLGICFHSKHNKISNLIEELLLLTVKNN